MNSHSLYDLFLNNIEAKKQVGKATQNALDLFSYLPA
jgi:hypothetical protein